MVDCCCLLRKAYKNIEEEEANEDEIEPPASDDMPAMNQKQEALASYICIFVLCQIIYIMR